MYSRHTFSDFASDKDAFDEIKTKFCQQGPEKMHRVLVGGFRENDQF